MDNKRRMVLDVFWIILGILLNILAFMDIIGNIYQSMGTAFLIIGVINLGRSIRYQKDSDYKEKVDIAVSDERNRYIRMKAWSWAGYTAILINGVLTIYFMITGQKTLMLFASYTDCLILALYVVFYCTLQRKE